jgi:hypothetical protein
MAEVYCKEYENLTEVERILVDTLERIAANDPGCNAYPLQEGPDHSYWKVEKTENGALEARGTFNGFQGSRLKLSPKGLFWIRYDSETKSSQIVMGPYVRNRKLLNDLERNLKAADGVEKRDWGKFTKLFSLYLRNRRTSEISGDDYYY